MSLSTPALHVGGAASLRHEILLRALPVQRHDVMAPLSVVRLGLATLKRRLQAGTPDLDEVKQLVSDIEAEMASVVSQLSGFRCWDPLHGDHAPAMAVASHCANLARPGLSLSGHRLGLPTWADEAEPAETQVPVPHFYYALLGLFWHVQDSVSRPSQFGLTVTPEGMQLQAQALPLEGAGHHAPLAQARVIDEDAMRGLADELALRFVSEGEGWTLGWR
jgi:hypothetical protein